MAARKTQSTPTKAPRKKPGRPRKTQEAPGQAIVRNPAKTGGEAPLVPMKVVNELVGRLTKLANHSGVDMAFRVGELVVQELFQGNVELLHKTGPKSKSLKQLEDHPQLPFSPVNLTRSIKTYEILSRNPALRREELGVSHFTVVQSLSAAQQDRLLLQAADKGWTVKELADKAQKHKGSELASGEKGPGRPPLPAGIKVLHRMHKALRWDGEELVDAGFVEELEQDDLEKVQEELNEVQKWCTEVAALVHRKLGTVDAVPETYVENQADE